MTAASAADEDRQQDGHDRRADEEAQVGLVVVVAVGPVVVVVGVAHAADATGGRA
jgi:hypothetical protein